MFPILINVSIDGLTVSGLESDVNAFWFKCWPSCLLLLISALTFTSSFPPIVLFI